jgi:hypothetical protein
LDKTRPWYCKTRMNYFKTTCALGNLKHFHTTKITFITVFSI